MAKIDVLNRALQEIAEELGTSPDDSTEQMEKANRLYPRVVAELLAKHNWKFATKRIQLTEWAEEPAYGDYILFALPGDCVTPLKNNPDDSYEDDYSVEGNLILVNSSILDPDAPVFNFRYIHKNLEILEGLMPEIFERAVALAIAEAMAIDFSGSASAAEALLTKSLKALREAKSHDSRIGTSDSLTGGEQWINARV